jgi:MFS family permease
MRRTGRYKAILPLGLGVTTLAYALLAMMTQTTSTWTIVLVLLLLGLSMGGCIPTINVAVQNAADPRDLGIAISTVTFARSLGGAFGAALFWSLLLGFLNRDIEGATIAARTLAFHNVFLIGAAIAALTMLAALRMREEPLQTTRPGERGITATTDRP